MKIQIFDHMDIGTYLQAIYQYRKSENKKFSFATWATEIGFTNKTILRLILQRKRRMTEKSIALLKKNLNLSGAEEEYFAVLVEYSQAKSTQQRKAMGQKLIEMQRLRFSPLEVPTDTGILQDVYGPLVLMAVSSFDKPVSLSQVAKHVPLSLDRLQQIADVLVEANFIEQKNETYQAKQNTFKIGDHFGHAGLKRYYQYWFEKSVHAINLPYNLRRFRSLQVALSAEEFESVVAKLNEFATNLLSQYETNTLDQRSLYLIQSALFPARPTSGSFSS